MLNPRNIPGAWRQGPIACSSQWREKADETMKPRLAVARLLICGVLLVLSGCADSGGNGTNPKTANPNLVIGTVHVEILFGSDRSSIQNEVDCMNDTTVFSALQAAAEKGGYGFESTGVLKGDKFITSIGGVDNLAADGKNWIYQVNDVLGDKSSGVYAVQPEDRVVWSFGKYEPE